VRSGMVVLLLWAALCMEAYSDPQAIVASDH